MNWNQYSKYLDSKIADARYNYEIAERRWKEAQAKYEAAKMEKESFERAVGEIADLSGKIELASGMVEE